MSVRILHIVNTLGAGGMENGVVNLCHRLDRTRFESRVVGLRGRGEFADRMPDWVDVDGLIEGPGFSWGRVRALRQKVREFRPDVLHTHNLGPLLHAGLIRILGSNRVPILHGEHAELADWEKNRKRIIERRLLYRMCSAVHTVSEGLVTDLSSVGLRHPQLLSIPNGVDLEHFYPTGPVAAGQSVQGAPKVGLVGRFGDHKRHDLALAAAEASDGAAFQLVFVGDGGPKRAEVLDWVERLPEKRVDWLGSRTREELPSIYRGLDLLIIPSANEGLSNVMLEAMACGVPVLTNRNCGAEEVLGDGRGGWIEDLSLADDPGAELSRLIAQKLGDSEGLAQASREAREKVEQHYGLARMVDEYVRLYEKIGGGP